MSRKVSNRGGKLISLVSVGPQQGSIWAEGNLERDFLRLLATDPDVDRVQAQPVKITYTYDTASEEVWLGRLPGASGSGGGSRLRWTVCYPDFLVCRKSGRPWMVEVWGRKPDDRLRRKAAASRLYAESVGYDFGVLTAADIRGQALQHAGLIRRYARTHVSFAVRESVFQMLARAAMPLPCSRIAEELGGTYSEALALVYSLIASGHLVPISRGTLGPTTVVAMRGEGSDA